MNALEVGKSLLKHVENNTTIEGIDKLYASDAVSMEAADMDGGGRETKGAEAIKGKHQWWSENFEVHDASSKGPWPHGDDRFAVIYAMDVTHKESGQRSQMEEVGIYHVKDGKIVREEFFYTPGM